MATGKNSISFLSPVAAVLFAIFVLFSAVMLAHKLSEPLLEPRWFINKKENRADIIDFFQYYQASDLAKSPKRSQVYDPETQKWWADKLTEPIKSEKVFYNQQPPSSYTLLFPLAFLPPNIAYVVWCITQTAFGLFGLFVLSKLGPLKSKDRWLFILGTLASFPAYSLVWHGNTSFFLLGCLSLFIAFLYRRRDLVSGIFLSLSTFKPQYLFPLLMPVLAMKRWQVIISFILLELITVGLAVPIIGFDNVVGYPYIVTHAESSKNFIGVNAHKMISIRGPIALIADTALSLKLTALVMFALLIPLFVLWRKCTDQISVPGLRWLWAVTICTIVLVSPHSHLFDFLLLAMAACLTLPTLSLFDLKKLKLEESLWTALFVLFPPLSWIANFTLGQNSAPTLFFFPYLSILFILSLINLICILKRQTPERD